MKVGLFICDCGKNISGVIDNTKLIDYFSKTKDLHVVGDQYLCAELGLNKIIEEIKDPEKISEEKRLIKKPLYLPRYTVRITLMIILIVFFLIDNFVQPISLGATNTLIDILIIAILYFIGTFFRKIMQMFYKKKLKVQIEEIQNYQELSKYDILEKLDEQKRGGITNVGKSLFSIIVFIAVWIFLTIQGTNLR